MSGCSAAVAALSTMGAVQVGAKESAQKTADWIALLKECDQTLDTLQSNWADITKTQNGDEVRRYLGTVGSTSPLSKLRTAIQALQRADDLSDDVDLEAFAMESETLLNAIVDADARSYEANFADFSGGGQLKASQFIEKAYQQVLVAQKAIKALIKTLSA